jgi:iron complex outermembrane recepter protein
MPRSAVLLGLSLTTAGLCVTAHADEPTDPAIEEIIVTAQRREQNVQDVAAAISVVRGDDFSGVGFDGVKDLASFVPNLSFGESNGEGSNQFVFVRGIGLNDFGSHNESNVAVYVDGIYQGSLAALSGHTADVERIEALRGPQGTLYGRNATGGLVHFISKRPTKSFEGSLEASTGSFDALGAQAVLSGPFSDRVQGRLLAEHYEDDGIVENTFASGRGSVQDINNVRASIAFQPSDALDVLLSGGVIHSRGSSYFHKPFGLLDANGDPCTLAQSNALQCFDSFGYRGTNPDPRKVELGEPAQRPQDNDVYRGTLDVNWRGDDGWAVRSLTGYLDTKRIADDQSYAGIGIPPVLSNFSSGSRQLTQEIQLSHTSSSLFWLAGLFYFDDTKDGTFDIGGESFFAGAYANDWTQDTTSYAAFTNATWTLTPRWALNGGLRWTHEDRDFHSIITLGDLFGGGGLTPSGSLSDDDVSFDLGANFRASDAVMLYAKASKGFKSGGFNVSAIFQTAPEQFEPFDSEELYAYEIGAKTTWLQGALTLNAAAFYYDYRDFQGFNQQVVQGAPVSVLDNFGDARNTGMEVELAWIASDHFDFQLGAGVLDTEIDAPGTFADGNDLVYAPHFTADGAARFHTSIGTSTELRAQIGFTHQGEYFTSLDNSPFYAGGDYTTWRGRVALFFASRYELAVYGENLTDEDYITGGFPAFDNRTMYFNRPRTLGVSLRATF